MKTTPPRQNLRAFTLVELLTVIAIVGILAAIVIPTVGKVRDTAQRSVDGNNLRELARAMLLYAAENNERLPDPQALAAAFPDSLAVHRIPAALARHGALSEPSFYFSKLDAAFNGSYPGTILDPAVAARNQLDDGFTEGRVFSWEFVGGVRLSDPPTTPIAYTRGLNAQGNWDPVSGAYRDAGGYIAFLGGNVVYYTSAAGKLVSYATGQPVSDIRQAIPNAAGMPARLYATPPAAGTVLGTTAGAPPP